jgi:short-subunit dehydrogenase
MMRKERSGLIVKVSSTAGFLPVRFMALYTSSRHAVAGTHPASRSLVRWRIIFRHLDR